MREIKFRAQRIQTREWIYGNLVIDMRGRAHIVPFKYFDEDGHHLSYEDDTDMSVFIDQETVTQFTGLHDKNGKEIYEGDVCKIWYHDNTSEIMKVDFDSEKAQFRFLDIVNDGWIITQTPVEVVGNIHENPELLK